MVVRHCLIGAAAAVVWFFVATTAGRAADGYLTEVKRFDLDVIDFAVHPTQPLVYASMFLDDKVAVIDTRSLSIVAQIPVGDKPRGLSVAPSGDRLYVANLDGNSISVINTATNAVVNTFPTPYAPWDVIAQSNQRLFVGGERIYQINPTTGGSAGADINGFGGAITATADRKTLFVGAQSTPGRIYQYDVSATNAVQVYASPFNTVGDNGSSIIASHDGKQVVYLTGTGNVPNYNTAIYNTATWSLDGVISGIPSDVAFSPDDLLIYTSRGDVLTDEGYPSGDRWIQAHAGDVASVAVSADGRYFFASSPQTANVYGLPGKVQIFDTGRAVPEPAAPLTSLAALTLTTLARRRRRRAGR
jgi:YVTN family beta-propeller protein